MVWLPPKVKQELVEERLHYKADLDAACYSDWACHERTRELKQLDPLLRMVRAPEHVVLGTPLIPGHYHIIRDNINAPPTVIVVADAAGGFREPSSADIEELKRSDLQNPAVVRDREKAKAEFAIATERDKQNKREARRAKMVEDYKAVTNASVSMNRDTPWSQNAAGKKGATRKKAA